jgi:hypothetical protein
MLRFTLVAVLISGYADAAPCPQLGLVPHVLATPDAAIAEDGGILVAAQSTRSTDPWPTGDVAAQPDWRLGGITPKITVLAPGLDVYGIDGASDLTLTDKAGARLARVRRVAASPHLPAPRVTAIRFEDTRQQQKHGGISITAAVASVPADAAAMIIYGPDGVARSWGYAGASVYLFATNSCGPLPDGTQASALGERVTVAWVDHSGRLSDRSAPITIGKP